MKTAKRITGVAFAILFLVGLSAMAPSLMVAGEDRVGVGYSGPYPLKPKPIGNNTLQGEGTVLNSGNIEGLYTVTVVVDSTFSQYFTYAISDNNFTMQPGEAKKITFTFWFKPETPVQDFSASITIVASPTYVPPGSSPGRASFSLPVAIEAETIPEFPSILLMLLAAIAVTMLATKRIKLTKNRALP